MALIVLVLANVAGYGVHVLPFRHATWRCDHCDGVLRYNGLDGYTSLTLRKAYTSSVHGWYPGEFRVWKPWTWLNRFMRAPANPDTLFAQSVFTWSGNLQWSDSAMVSVLLLEPKRLSDMAARNLVVDARMSHAASRRAAVLEEAIRQIPRLAPPDQSQALGRLSEAFGEPLDTLEALRERALAFLADELALDSSLRRELELLDRAVQLVSPPESGEPPASLARLGESIGEELRNTDDLRLATVRRLARAAKQSRPASQVELLARAAAAISGMDSTRRRQALDELSFVVGAQCGSLEELEARVSELRSQAARTDP